MLSLMDEAMEVEHEQGLDMDAIPAEPQVREINLQEDRSLLENTIHEKDREIEFLTKELDKKDQKLAAFSRVFEDDQI